MADQSELSYFAGFFDGEGCVAMYRRKYVVSLTNTDVRPLVRAKELWGGSIVCQKKEVRKGAIQDLWRWQIYGHKSRKFLEDIRQFTKIKCDQIDCYLETLNLIPVERGERRASGSSQVIDLAISKLKLLKRGVA